MMTIKTKTKTKTMNKERLLSTFTHKRCTCAFYEYENYIEQYICSKCSDTGKRTTKEYKKAK